MEPPTMSWSEMNENTLITSGEDDFSNFLEFNMNFDLEGHGPLSHSQLHDQHAVQPPTTTPETTMASGPSYLQYAETMESMDGLAMNFSQSQPGPIPYSTPDMTPGFSAQDASQQAIMSQSQSQQYIQSRQIIPPTPNSIEMHSGSLRYPQSQRVNESSEMYDQYTRMNEEQALYTPLISPAMTPLENQFRLPEYTIPGEYSFSPLSSPALEAQSGRPAGNGFQQYHSKQLSVSDVGYFPNNPEANHLPGTSAPPSPSIIRKSKPRRTSTVARLSGRNTNKAKQSPSMTQRGKPGANTEEFYKSLSEELEKPPNHDVCSIQNSSNDDSQDSVSPEALSDPLMPPPALPTSRKASLKIDRSAHQSSGAAATPATLMRILRSQQAGDSSARFIGNAQLEVPDEIMEDICLPESAAPQTLRPKPVIDTRFNSNNAGSPAISAAGTPFLSPGSVCPSPRTLMPSPSGPIPRKSISGASRKRPSLSSTHASPQLRPKISPSIQPLMRAGDLGLSQDALCLASKSNYQHILDGTLPSGVSYPENLAENLSSKRTNHKLAEQGRRNRINAALKEIEALIPSEFIQARQAKEAAASGITTAEKEREKEKEKSNQSISKASAVEMAIDYIKDLQKSLAEANAKLAIHEAKNLASNGDTHDQKVELANGKTESHS